MFVFFGSGHVSWKNNRDTGKMKPEKSSQFSTIIRLVIILIPVGGTLSSQNRLEENWDMNPPVVENQMVGCFPSTLQ